MTDTRRPLRLDDLSQFALVSDPQTSPDHSRIAWVVTTIDDEHDTYRSAIWVAQADGSQPRQLTSGTWRDSSPRWSPDGRRIAFVSNREPMLAPPDDDDKTMEPSDENATGNGKGKAAPDATKTKHPNQIWVIRLDGGEAMQVTNHRHGASSPSWAPDGTALAFTGSDAVTGDDDFTAPMTKGGVADEMILQDTVYRFDGRGWRDRYSHIWAVALDAGEMRQLTFGDVFDSDPQWSPTGEHIAFVANRRGDRRERPRGRAIHVVPAAGGDVRALTDDDVSLDMPAWSPTGDRLAFLGHTDGTDNTKNVLIWTVSADGQDCRSYGEAADISFSDYGMSDVHEGSEARPIWAGDDAVQLLASRRGETQIFEISLSNNTVTQRTHGKQRITGFAPLADGWAVARATISAPATLSRIAHDGAECSVISDPNAALLTELDLPEVIDLDIVSADGWGIQAWLMPPVGREDGARYPLIVQIHGGPHAMYGYDFFHEMQWMAAQGYGVLFCNPRGSAGYGYHFTACTRANWDESDMPDVMATLDTALEVAPWIDRDRIGVTGGSYGGYLTNWIVSHTDRFKAAVTQRCVSNFTSFFGTSDIGINFGEFEFGGVPWRDAELLRRHSPISYVENLTTPLLIVHSENDLRCPIEQAEQMFTALKYLGRTTEFIRIPEESHGLSRNGTPSRRRARLHHIMRWFDTYL